jgi:hypothetical protein
MTTAIDRITVSPRPIASMRSQGSCICGRRRCWTTTRAMPAADTARSRGSREKTANTASSPAIPALRRSPTRRRTPTVTRTAIAIPISIGRIAAQTPTPLTAVSWKSSIAPSTIG